MRGLLIRRWSIGGYHLLRRRGSGRLILRVRNRLSWLWMRVKVRTPGKRLGIRFWSTILICWNWLLRIFRDFIEENNKWCDFFLFYSFLFTLLFYFCKFTYHSPNFTINLMPICLCISIYINYQRPPLWLTINQRYKQKKI